MNKNNIFEDDMQQEVMKQNLLDSIKHNIFMNYDELNNCQYKFITDPNKNDTEIDLWRVKYDKMTIADDALTQLFTKAIQAFPIYRDTVYNVYYNVKYNSTHKFSQDVPYYIRKIAIVTNKKDDKHANGKLKERAFITLRTPTTQITMPFLKYKGLDGKIYDPYYPTIFNACAIGDINPNEYFEELKRWFIIVRRCYDPTYWHYPYFGGIGMSMPDMLLANINGHVNNFGSMRIFKNYIKLTKVCRAQGVIPYQKPTEDNPGGYGYIEPNDYNMYCHLNFSPTRMDKLCLSRFPTETVTYPPFAQNAKQLSLEYGMRGLYTPSKAGRPKGSTNRVHKMISVKHEARDPWDVWADKY